ncbi:MAG: serine hydrolase domain-containing protein [Pseudomonadota bacterium]
MNKLLVKATIVLFSVVSHNMVSANDDKLSAYVEAAQAEHEVAGLAVAVVDLDGIRFLATAGERERGSGKAIAAGDLWHLGSCTKAMTALMVATLVESGEADWSDTIPRLFPALADNMDPAWGEVTLRDLLTHRAGVGNLGIPWLFARHGDKAPLQEQRAGTVKTLLQKPPRETPGEFAYSNFGYIMAGHWIETKTGQTWENAFRQGLPSTLMGDEAFGFGPPQGDQPVGHKRILFFGNGAVGQEPEKADNPAALGPAGTVHASLQAWARFVSAFFVDDGRLSPSMLEDMITSPEGDVSYALGWGVYESERFGRAIAHSGSNTFWVVRADVFVDANLAVLVAINQGDDKALKASDAIAGEVIRRIADQQ